MPQNKIVSEPLKIINKEEESVKPKSNSESKPVIKDKKCFESVTDPASGKIYYVEKNKDGEYTEKSQWEKPESKDMCKKERKMSKCFESVTDPASGKIYYVEKNKDGEYTEKSQWEKPESKDMCKKERKISKCKTHSDCEPTKPYCNEEKCNELPWLENECR